MEEKNPVTNNTVCSICDFPLSLHTQNGWFNNVAEAEHLFVINIYSPLEIKSMNIVDIDYFIEILYRI